MKRGGEMIESKLKLETLADVLNAHHVVESDSQITPVSAVVAMDAPVTVTAVVRHVNEAALLDEVLSRIPNLEEEAQVGRTNRLLPLELPDLEAA